MSQLQPTHKANRSPLARRSNKLGDDYGFNDLKKVILENAGFTPELLGHHLGMALAALTEGLGAEKTQYFTHAGVVTDSRTDIDHNTRLKAAAELASIITILGDMRSTPNHGVGGGTSITLNVPFLADLKVESSTIDVTPVDSPSPCLPTHKQDQAPSS